MWLCLLVSLGLAGSTSNQNQADQLFGTHAASVELPSSWLRAPLLLSSEQHKHTELYRYVHKRIWEPATRQREADAYPRPAAQRSTSAEHNQHGSHVFHVLA